MRKMLGARTTSWILAGALLIVPAVGCSNTPSGPPPPPVDDTAARRAPASTPADPPHAGMSTGKKLVILGGAAALYYLYKHHQAAKADGAEGQYYLSKNGRVYYRDADHRAHWVTPPPEGISVSEDEAKAYQEYQGYDNRSTGKDLTNLAEATADPS